MYFKYCWGFGGTKEQKAGQKEQLKRMIEALNDNVTVTITDVTDELFTIQVEEKK